MTWFEIIFIAIGLFVLIVLPLIVIINQKSHKTTEVYKERFWLLKINPKTFNIFDTWRDHPEIETDLWMSSYFKFFHHVIYLSYLREYMNKGDKIALWITGDVPGIYALGEITDKPYAVSPDLLVPIRYTVKLFDKPLTREHDPIKQLAQLKYTSAERIYPSMWSYIKESAENEIRKRNGMATKEVHFKGKGRPVWMEK